MVLCVQIVLKLHAHKNGTSNMKAWNFPSLLVHLLAGGPSTSK
jgi:hypothetical protein